MARDGKGASWLQASDELRNPYYGASMLRCGTTERRHPGGGRSLSGFRRAAGGGPA
jgi:Cu(I)/Ag(I) efflux system membrane fusion protein